MQKSLKKMGVLLEHLARKPCEFYNCAHMPNV